MFLDHGSERDDADEDQRSKNSVQALLQPSFQCDKAFRIVGKASESFDLVAEDQEKGVQDASFKFSDPSSCSCFLARLFLFTGAHAVVSLILLGIFHDFLLILAIPFSPFYFYHHVAKLIPNPCALTCFRFAMLEQFIQPLSPPEHPLTPPPPLCRTMLASASTARWFH
jgi:hypothetical protein